MGGCPSRAGRGQKLPGILKGAVDPGGNRAALGGDRREQGLGHAGVARLECEPQAFPHVLLGEQALGLERGEQGRAGGGQVPAGEPQGDRLGGRAALAGRQFGAAREAKMRGVRLFQLAEFGQVGRPQLAPAQILEPIGTQPFRQPTVALGDEEIRNPGVVRQLARHPPVLDIGS